MVDFTSFQKATTAYLAIEFSLSSWAEGVGVTLGVSVPFETLRQAFPFSAEPLTDCGIEAEEVSAVRHALLREAVETLHEAAQRLQKCLQKAALTVAADELASSRS